MLAMRVVARQPVPVMNCTRIVYSMLLCGLFAVADARQTENVILVVFDGVRTEEMFHGANLDLLRDRAGRKPVEDTVAYRDFWADTAAQRRERLMPFFWTELMRNHGSIAGDHWNGSAVRLRNRHLYSYPGYAEILTGEAQDDVITGNAPVQNPFPTVLEFVRAELDLSHARVAAFSAWEVMTHIVENTPGSLFHNAGFQAYPATDPAISLLNRLQFATRTPWDDVRHDIYTFRFAMHHLKVHQPRLLFINLNETDDWSHEKRYDRYLQALRQMDDFLRELWEFIQTDSHYRNRTTLLLTTDHGRGTQPDNWTSHGPQHGGSDRTWIAVAGPDHSRRGIWIDSPGIHMTQIAATLAAFLGLDYVAWKPGAGQPIDGFLE
jgi:hypothetical protein